MAAILCWGIILLAGLACSSAELGSQTSIEEYPSIAQVENLAGELWVQHCVASVLTNYHVLSTAQCFSGVNYSDRSRRIRAGTSYRGKEGIVREVDRVHIHPNFGLLGNDGDIAVVRLQDALILGDTIQQAQILGEGIYLPTGLQLKLVSWGTTAAAFPLKQSGAERRAIHQSNGLKSTSLLHSSRVIGESLSAPLILSGNAALVSFRENLPSIVIISLTKREGGLSSNKDLYELNLYTINNDECLETYLELDGLPNNTITENMFCVGLRDAQGRNLDSKDIGAPLFYEGVTMGVVSFGVSDGEDSVPVVSTAITSYSNWIVETARN